jgi:hypothetical protein
VRARRAAAMRHATHAVPRVTAPRRAFIAKHVLLFLAFKLFSPSLYFFGENIIFAMLKMTSS